MRWAGRSVPCLHPKDLHTVGYPRHNISTNPNPYPSGCQTGQLCSACPSVTGNPLRIPTTRDLLEGGGGGICLFKSWMLVRLRGSGG